MSPCTPPAVFVLSAGEPVIPTESNDSGREIRLHVERDDRLLSVADAVLMPQT